MKTIDDSRRYPDAETYLNDLLGDPYVDLADEFNDPVMNAERRVARRDYAEFTDSAADPIAASAAANRIASEQRALVELHEMLDATAVSKVLSKAATSDNTASHLAATGAVVALPASGQTLYPAFQFDPIHQQVRPIVAELNQALGAKNDPWGVASWWLDPAEFTDDPRSPAELAVAGGHEHDLRDLATDAIGGHGWK